MGRFRTAGQAQPQHIRGSAVGAGPAGTSGDTGSSLLLPVRLWGAKKRVRARTRQPWPLLSSNTAAAEGGRRASEDVGQRTAAGRGSGRCQARGGCPWLRAPCPAPRVPGSWRSHTCSGCSGCEGAAHAAARPGRLRQRAALSARAASSLPPIFSSLYYFPPSTRNENEALAAGTSPRPCGSAGGGWAPPGRGGGGEGSALTLSPGMLRGAPGSAIGCAPRSRPAPGLFMGRGPRAATRSSPGTRCRPPCAPPWWTFPKNTWKGRTPSILRGRGMCCPGDGLEAARGEGAGPPGHDGVLGEITLEATPE